MGGGGLDLYGSEYGGMASSYGQDIHNLQVPYNSGHFFRAKSFSAPQEGLLCT